MDDGGGERREEALAAAAVLRPEFKASKVTQDQINKLKELRKKRLRIKAKFDSQKRVKATKSCESKLAAKSIEDDAMTIPVEVDTSLVKQHKEVSFSAPKKHQKLYWGLDTRERWERKSNM